jgi:hypothetical protein
MKKVITSITNTECRAIDITEEEKTAFSQYKFLQRYYPGLDLFSSNDMSLQKNMTIPTRYSILSWKQEDNEQYKGKYWICDLKENTEQSLNKSIFDVLFPEESQTVDVSGQILKDQKVFVKIIHLLDPIGILRHEYMTPEHPLLPQGEKAWRHTLQKLHSPNNQAYVDTIANFVLSRFRELDLTPHCTLFYGSMTGIANSYKYRISDDYGSYKQCRWFWKGMESHGAKLEVIKDGLDISKNEEFSEIVKNYFCCPFENDSQSVTDLTPDNMLPTFDKIDDGTNSLHSFTFDDNIVNKLVLPDTPNVNSGMKKSESHESGLGFSAYNQDSLDIPELIKEDESVTDELENRYDDEDDEDDDDDDDDSENTEDSFEINLELPSMPVILVYQERQEGTMDELLEKEEINGHEQGSKEWESMWLAWIWQIMAALGFLQKAICFTHNDLHTNNIIWRNTDQEYLYYKSRDGTTWRVPTYGKIFSLIDFGRSIFRLGKQLWISDDYWPDHEADGQYNFGPIYNPLKPKITPNPSFDLCRLAISMIDGLFDDIPSKKKGKNVALLSKDGDWKVHETKSQLFNLLFSWTVDDQGKTLYQTEFGDERYPGFELYIHIAQDVHNAIPREQFTKPVFDMFRYPKKLPENCNVYSIGN